MSEAGSSSASRPSSPSDDSRTSSLAGAVDDASRVALLHGSDVFALPSHAEGQPIAILEGMAAGLPILSSTVGSIPEVVGSRTESSSVPLDVEGIVAAIERLADDRGAARADRAIQRPGGGGEVRSGARVPGDRRRVPGALTVLAYSVIAGWNIALLIAIARWRGITSFEGLGHGAPRGRGGDRLRGTLPSRSSSPAAQPKSRPWWRSGSGRALSICSACVCFGLGLFVVSPNPPKVRRVLSEDDARQLRWAGGFLLVFGVGMKMVALGSQGIHSIPNTSPTSTPTTWRSAARHLLGLGDRARHVRLRDRVGRIRAPADPAVARSRC